MGKAIRSVRLAVRGSLLAGVVGLVACAGQAPEPPRAPRLEARLSPQQVETVARLVHLEDTRGFDDAVLREAAASASPEVRVRAALALGRLRRPEGLRLLAPLLQDPDTSVAATAAFALGQVGDSAAVALLAPLVAGSVVVEHPSLASEAAYALGKLRSAAAHDALGGLLSRTDPIPSEVVGSALLAVWRFPLPADIAPILRWTESPDPEVRWRAAYALSRRPTPGATARLAQLAADPAASVRAAALRGVTAPQAQASGMDAEAALATVLTAATDSVYQVRIAAIRALGTYSDPRAVRLLATLATGEPTHAALAATEALGQIGRPAVEVVPALRDVALDQGAHVAIRQAALAALTQIDPSTAASAAQDLATAGSWRMRAAAARSLAQVHAPLSGELGRLVRDTDGRVAAAGLEALLQAAGDSVRPLRGVLVEALGSADVWVRSTALGGLARLGEPATLPLLLDAYQRASRDSLNDAALAAIDALAALGTGTTMPQRAFFARFARSPDYLVRLRAQQRFGASADSAWGQPLPIETGRSLAEYRVLVERWLARPPGERAEPLVELATDRGTMRVRLFAADAPLTTESLMNLARTGYFDGQEWPRVVPNFVVQGGDPRGDTNGGPGYALRDEINRHRYQTGSLGMALSGPDTGGSQFFVTHSPQPHLDGIYTIFGEVVDGQTVAERTLPGDRIQTIRIVQ